MVKSTCNCVQGLCKFNTKSLKSKTRVFAAPLSAEYSDYSFFWTVLIQKTQASIYLLVPAPVHSCLLFPLQDDAVNYITELIRIKSDWPDCVLTQTVVLKHGEGARLRTQLSGCVCVWAETLTSTSASAGLKHVRICSMRETLNVLGGSQQNSNY